jgi:hypothetical protein|nr:hypothetical protein [Kofleriaceae bacterium]
MRLAILSALAAMAAGCAGLAGPGGVAPDGQGGNADAGAGCTIALAFDPDPATAGSDLERVTATVSPPVPYTYAWTVLLGGSNVAFTPVGDDSSIDFGKPVAGEYDLGLEVTSNVSGVFCTTSQALNVAQPGANETAYRVHVTPPPSSNAPPIEQDIVVQGGANQAVDIPFPPLQQFQGTVTANGSAALAYVRVTPASSSAFVETYSVDASGFGPLSVVAGAQDVLVVPSSATLAPRLVHWQVGQSTAFTLDGGSPVTGRVVDSAGTGIAGAAVQLQLGGVLPSTVATTAADGTFTVHADTSDAGLDASVTVQVAPPLSSGLPRLSATSAFPLGSAIAIAYPAQTVRDLGGVAITQGGAPVANAQVMVVGSLASFAGTIDGAAAQNAVLVAGKTTASGAVAGSTRAPAAPVSVVVTLATGEVEVAAVDLTASVPASIALPAAAVRTGIVRDATANPLAGVQVQLQPAGALAQAGALLIEATTDATGAYSVALAATGSYDVRVIDLAARGPIATATAQAPSQIGDVTLATGLVVDGTVTLTGTAKAIGASVQFLCTNCSGVAASQPVAESATDLDGSYRVSVPDPGVAGVH